MKKNYFFVLLLSVFFTAACKEKPLPEGLYVSGDVTEVLRVWRGEKNKLMQIGNSDTLQTKYPFYLLEINAQYAIFQIRQDTISVPAFYYVLKPALKTNTAETIEVENLKLILGKGIVSGLEIINPDDTKSVIIAGRITKK